GGLLAVMTSFQTDDNHFANWYYRRDPTHVVFYRESTFHYLAQQYQYTCKIPCQNVVFLQKPKTQIAIKPVSSSVQVRVRLCMARVQATYSMFLSIIVA